MIDQSDDQIEEQTQEQTEDKPKKTAFRQYFYRGYQSEQLQSVPHDELLRLFHSRARRRFNRGTVNEHLLKRIRRARLQGSDKQTIVKTHLRNAIIIPEMIGASIGVYSGLGYYLVDVKPTMVGHYLGEFSLTYTPVRHAGKTAAANVSKFIPIH